MSRNKKGNKQHKGRTPKNNDTKSFKDRFLCESSILDDYRILERLNPQDLNLTYGQIDETGHFQFTPHFYAAVGLSPGKTQNSYTIAYLNFLSQAIRNNGGRTSSDLRNEAFAKECTSLFEERETRSYEPYTSGLDDVIETTCVLVEPAPGSLIPYSNLQSAHMSPQKKSSLHLVNGKESAGLAENNVDGQRVKRQYSDISDVILEPPKKESRNTDDIERNKRILADGITGAYMMLVMSTLGNTLSNATLGQSVMYMSGMAALGYTAGTIIGRILE